MNFRVGQKVVFVGPGEGPCNLGWGTEILPQVGGIYTVREKVQHAKYSGLRLVEIVNPPQSYEEGFVECDFHPRVFRPVVERKTDISVFTKILDDVKAGVPVTCD